MWGGKAHSRQFPLGAASAAAMMAAALICAAPNPAFAQDAPQQFQQLLGNLIGAAIQQAQIVEDAKRSWDGIDQRLQVCLLRTYNLSPAQLARNGVRSDNPGLGQYLQSCQQLVWQQIQERAQQPQSGVPDKTDHGWFGAVTVDMTDALASDRGLSSSAGVLVVDVHPHTPADRAGIKPGDIILRLNGLPVEDGVIFDAILLWMREGGNAPVTVMHDKNPERVRATLDWAFGIAPTPISQPPAPELPETPPPTPRSWYVVRATASEAGSGTEDALLTAAKSKVETICAGDYSVTKYHRFDRTGQDASINGLREPWLDAEAACTAERPIAPEVTASSLAIDDLIRNARSDAAKAMPNAEFFDLHSGVFDAGYDAVLDAVTAALIDRGARIALSDTAKGMIVTEYPVKWGTPHVEQFFIVIDPESTTRTRVTFKLISYWGNVVSPDVAAHHIADNETVRRRAEEFIAAVQRLIAR